MRTRVRGDQRGVVITAEATMLMTTAAMMSKPMIDIVRRLRSRSRLMAYDSSRWPW